MNDTYHTSFTVRAGNLSALQRQSSGRFVSNAVIDNVRTCAGEDPCETDERFGSVVGKNVGKGNVVLIWTIPELQPGESGPLTAEIDTFLNPKNKWTCGIKPVTGQWNTSANQG